MDSDSGGRETRRSQPRNAREGPRGRGLGKPTGTAFKCAVCGAKQLSSEVEPAAQCTKCGADLHTCSHCVHFDSSAVHECRQRITVRVVAKARRNDCELFEPRTTQEIGSDGGGAPSDPRAAFNALFD